MVWCEMNNLQKCLSNNMKKYRKLKNLSQEKLAEKAGASSNYIALIESGKNFPSLPMLAQIANALEIDELDLFNAAGLDYNNFQEMYKRISKEMQEVLDRNFSQFS